MDRSLSLLRRVLLAAATMLVGCGGLNMSEVNKNAPKGTGFMVKNVRVDDDTHNYGLFVPHDYTPTRRYPVIVFLHGVLQAGSNGTTNMGEGIGPTIAKHPEAYPFIVVFPQSSGDWTGDKRDHIAMACLDAVQRDYSTDPSRVILTGLSNGGYGVWHIGAMHPERFAALVPVAGQPDYEDVSKLTHIPIWCIHNSGDFLIFPGGSREMCKRIKEAGGNVKYTERQSFGHGDWDAIYSDKELVDWMLAQRGSGVGAPPINATVTK